MPSKNHGFVKIYRDITDWGWYTEPNTLRVYLHCILKANYTEKEWKGIKIPTGSFVTSYSNLAKELILTVQKVRTALKNLQNSKNLTIKSTHRFSIIEVNCYQFYQSLNTVTNNQLTHCQHADNTQLTTTNKRNKGRKEKRNYHEIFQKIKMKLKE